MTLLSPNVSKTQHKIQLLTFGVSFGVVPSPGDKRAPRWPLEGHFEGVLASGGKRAPRWLLGVRFERFQALVANAVPDSLWSLILSCSGLWW